MSQMYPAFSRTKKSKSNHELLEQLKENSLNWYEVEHEGYTLPGTKDPHSWCGSWSWKGCLNAPGHAGTEAKGKGFIKTFQKQCFDFWSFLASKLVCIHYSSTGKIRFGLCKVFETS